MNDTVTKLQALLLTSSGALPKKRLLQLLSCKESQLNKLLKEAEERYKVCGMFIVDDGVQIQLATNPALTPFLETVEKKENTMPLSKASQETLSIIAYAGPIRKSDLDFVRGVNTTYTLRRLLVRGLIRRLPGRTLAITTDLLVHLGLSSVEKLPEYERIRQSLQESIQSAREKIPEERV